MKNPDIKLLIASDVDYEKLLVEIYYKEKFVALLSQEEGLDKLKIEFPGPDRVEELLLRKLDLKAFEEALEMAKQAIRK